MVRSSLERNPSIPSVNPKLSRLSLNIPLPVKSTTSPLPNHSCQTLSVSLSVSMHRKFHARESASARYERRHTCHNACSPFVHLSNLPTSPHAYAYTSQEHARGRVRKLGHGGNIPEARIDIQTRHRQARQSTTLFQSSSSSYSFSILHPIPRLFIFPSVPFSHRRRLMDPRGCLW